MLHEDTRALLFERHVGNTTAIGRIARRQDGLTRLQERHRTRAVVIGALQGITRIRPTKTLHGDVQQARGKGALDARQLFKRLIGSEVCHVAKLILAAAHGARHHLLFGRDVEHLVADLQLAGRRLDVPDHDVLGTQRFPVTKDDLAAAGRQADHVLLGNRLEDPGVAHVVADDLGHVFGQDGTALPAERHDRDRNRPISATGDDDVLFLRHGVAQHEQEKDDETSKVIDHNARSSGVNVIMNERYG